MHDAVGAARAPGGGGDGDGGDDDDVEVHVVGHSLGGLLVRAFAECHPDAADGLATIGAPPPGFNAEWLPSVGHFDADGWFRCNVPAFLDRAFPGAPAEFTQLTWVQPPLGGRLPLPGGRGAERRLAICCRADQAIPYAQQRKAAQALGAPAVDVPTAHSPHVTHPALIASLLVNWLAPESA